MRRLLGAAIVLLLAGCDTWYTQVPSPDDLMHAIPWFDHMLMSKAIQPYQSDTVPRDTPAGAVPVGGGEADWRVGDPRTLVYFFDTLKAKALVHPKITPQPDSRSGQQLFNTYCAVCHNYNGDGHGPVSEMLALSLLTAQARGYTDGYLYSMIRYGRLRMPQYGDKITRIDERWALVDYIRALQAKAPVEPTPGVPAPAPTKRGH